MKRAEMSNKKRKLSDQTTEGSKDLGKEPRLIQQISSTTGTTLLYCRSDLMSQSEVNQQSSIQSTRTTRETPALTDSTALPVGPEMYKIQHFDEASQQTMHADKEDDSSWLYDVLHNIGATDIYRKMRQKSCIITEILQTFRTPFTFYRMGSTFEGTDTPGVPSDTDNMRCVEEFPVIEDIANAKKGDGINYSLLVVRELHTPCTPAGYVKLQLVIEDKPCTSEYWDIIGHINLVDMNRLFKIDKKDRLVLVECTWLVKHKLFVRAKNKPCDKSSALHMDNVISFRCKTWPTMAKEWLHRHRRFGWPTQETIEKLKSFGFFVVRKGNPLSLEIDLEWRISLSLQERQLMFDLTDVQHKCYIVLKTFNREVICLDCITTYHWKTCLFYAIEENDGNIWNKKLLWNCIELCIRHMLKWVKCGFCPNYFIPEENMFDGRLNSSGQVKLEKVLKKILDLGFGSLLLVNENNLGDYFRSRTESVERFRLLQAESKRIYNETVYIESVSLIQSALIAFNHKILQTEYCQANGKTLMFIRSLWRTLKTLHHPCDDITIGRTARDIKYSLSFMLPYIYTCLASNISSIAFQNSNTQIRDFLLLGCLKYLMNDDLSGRLKFISVLYAAGSYSDCEWWIDIQDEEYITRNPSTCRCRHIKNDRELTEKNIINALPKHVSTCVSFLPTELPIIPDAMKYEMFRYVGISLDENEKTDAFGRWQYRAIVDSNIYYFLLKYLIKRKLDRINEYEEAKSSIVNLLHGTNVRHRDVACNVLVWIFFTEVNTPKALLFSTYSWYIMISTDLCFMISTDTLAQKQYLYNAAKIHALVILYNTWFAKMPSSVHFCFHCLCESIVKLQKCSRCKVSTYCCKQCQKRNWKIHKKACKIVREYL